MKPIRLLYLLALIKLILPFLLQTPDWGPPPGRIPLPRGGAVEEGYRGADAVVLYKQLAENLEKSDELITLLKKEIRQAHLDNYIKDMRVACPAPGSDPESLRIREEEAKRRKEMGHLARHLLPHLLLKIFGG